MHFCEMLVQIIDLFVILFFIIDNSNKNIANPLFILLLFANLLNNTTKNCQ